MAPISAALGRVRPSPTIAATQRARELAAAGRDVVSLTAGEPDFDPPPHVAEAAARAVAEGRTRYTAPDGIPELKRAVAEKFRRDNGLSYEAAEIGVATGGKQVIWNALQATIDPGDEVVIFAPYWASYPDMVRLAGGTPVIAQTSAADGFVPRPEALAEAMGPATRWVVLNSPGNPTGAVIPPDAMAALAEVVLRHPSALLLSDDIYEHIRHGVPFATPAAVEPRLRERVLTVNGVSKAYAMTGWRIGYGGGPAPLLAAMRTVQSQTTSCPCSVAQWAAVAALDGPQDGLEARRLAYERRRDLVIAAIAECAGLECPVPDGAFYVYPSVAGCIGLVSAGGAAIEDDEAFAAALLEEEGVAVVHGAAFGASPAVRISTAASDDALAEAMRRLRRFCGGLR
jgi:aspartate aminotransferase